MLSTTKTHQNLLEKGFFVFYMKNGLSAVNCIKPFRREFSLCGITHFKLYLSKQHVVNKLNLHQTQYIIDSLIIIIQNEHYTATYLTRFRVFICLKCKVDHVSGQVKAKNMGVVRLKQKQTFIDIFKIRKAWTLWFNFDMSITIIIMCIYQSHARSNSKKNSHKTTLGFSFANNWSIKKKICIDSIASKFINQSVLLILFNPV